MVDVVLDEDEFTVFGGPASVSLNVDIGAQGDPGSKIYSVMGDPRLSTTSLSSLPTLRVYDILIDSDQQSETYKTVFQKTNSGTRDWSPVVSLGDKRVAKRLSLTFSTTGTANTSSATTISFSDFGDFDYDLIPSDFNVQCNVVSSNPTVISGQVEIIAETENINVVLSAAVFNGTTWSKLTGASTVDILISINNEDEES